MAKKVLRYTEEQFVTLLENIINKVKAEENRINEQRENHQRSLNRNTNRRRPR